MNKTLVLIQTVVPNYRTKVIDELREQLNHRFKIYCGDSFFDPTIRISEGFERNGALKNYYLVKRKFLWQTGHWKEVFKDNVLVISLNPRVLSHWIILVLRLFQFKKTFLWGHAWPRAGKNSKSDLIRHLMRLLASGIIVYTEEQAKDLKLKMPRKLVYAAPNALLLKKEMKVAQGDEVTDFIYVGRLVADKKPMLLYEAFKKALKNLPNSSKLFIIGDGPERLKIVDLVKKDHLIDRVIVPGAITEINVLEKYYETAIASVSPGYVGLSITQSLGYGVPMIIALNENHSPELEAAKNEFNARFFKSNDSDDLALKLIEFNKDKELWIQKRPEIVRDCQSRYSIESMIKAFIKLVEE